MQTQEQRRLVCDLCLEAGERAPVYGEVQVHHHNEGTRVMRPIPDPSGPAELDEAGMVAALKAMGYSVTKRKVQAAASFPYAAVSRSGKRHASCAAHYKVPGFREPVCVSRATDESGAAIPAAWSDPATVCAFAAEMAALNAHASEYSIAGRMAEVARIAAQREAQEAARLALMAEYEKEAAAA